MSACPYTGTTVIEKIPWEEEEADVKLDASENKIPKKVGLMNKLKRMFRK